MDDFLPVDGIFSSSDSGSSASESDSTSNSNVVASIITNDGEQKSMTAQDLADLDDANAVAFKNKYFGASVTLEANVVKVNSRTMREGYYMESYVELEDGWIIETDPDEVADLFPGDTVKAEGNIYSTDSRGFITIQIYRVNGHTTKVTKVN
ncbi:MAG: hypothetical protein IJ995_00440 [Clostridia bacterium]|nr:hypothetical protein [Clostridia bacterium]